MNSRPMLTLRLSRLLPAPRERVYRALTAPDELANWWGPKGFTAPDLEFEPRVGNPYRIAMRPPHGEVFHLSGEFREVDPPARLAYTFCWDPPDPDDRETLVELSLAKREGGTELTLVQGEFATPPRFELHRQGWTEGFERLRELLERSSSA